MVLADTVAFVVEMVFAIVIVAIFSTVAIIIVVMVIGIAIVIVMYLLKLLISLLIPAHPVLLKPKMRQSKTAQSSN